MRGPVANYSGFNKCPGKSYAGIIFYQPTEDIAKINGIKMFQFPLKIKLMRFCIFKTGGA